MLHFRQVVSTFRSTIPCNLRNLTNISLAAGFLLLGLSVSSAQAAVVAFVGDQAGWEAAAGGPVVLADFNSLPPPPGFSLTFGSSLPGGFVLDTSGGGFNVVYRDRAIDSQTTKPLIEASGNGVTAVGADWDLAFGGPGSGIRLFITFVGSAVGEFVTTEIPNTFAGEFFGIVSDVPISSIQFEVGTQGAGGVETFQLDNARFVSAVPIPAALPLFLSALAALGFVGRRKKRLAAV